MSYVKTLIFPPAALVQPRRTWCMWRIVLAGVVLAMFAVRVFAQTPEALQALQATAPNSEARKLAGQRICQAERGPLAVALWTADGSLICRVITQEARK